MRICAVQNKPVKGDIQQNITGHKRLIDLAVSNGAEIIIFPELSITSYEPELAKELATVPEDSRFDDFQAISNTSQVTIGISAPLKTQNGISIDIILFQPQKERQTYSKKYLHPDEEPFFVSGKSSVGLIGSKSNVALAICYETSVPEHAENAFKSGADIYLASVVKSVNGIDRGLKRLSDIAREYSMTVLMANSIGFSEGIASAGKSSIWNNKGMLVGQLDDENEGILIFDTDTQEVVKRAI